MAVYLPVRCPIFWEEIRRRLRGGRAFIVLLVYTAILVLFLLIVMLNKEIGENPRDWPSFGRALWNTFLIVQLIAIIFISPGLTAGAVSAEREQQQLDLVLLTRMGSLSIVLGKFLGAIVQMLLILFAGLPVISVVFMFGGVSPAEVAAGYAVILTSGIGCAALGFLSSCLFQRMAAAVAWGYGFMLILLIFLPLAVYLIILLGDMSAGLDEKFFIWLASVHPAVAAFSTIEPATEGHVTIWPSVIGMSGLAVLALAECTMLVRRLRGLSRRFVPRLPSTPKRTSMLPPSEPTTSSQP